MASRAEWTARVDEWRAGGESRDAFAARRGLNPKLLQWWASQLAREARKGAKSKAPPSVPFARVAAMASAHAMVTAGATTSAVEVVLARGRVIRVHAGFDAKLLGPVVDALEAR